MSYVYMWTTLTCLNLIGCSVCHRMPPPRPSCQPIKSHPCSSLTCQSLKMYVLLSTNHMNQTHALHTTRRQLLDEYTSELPAFLQALGEETKAHDSDILIETELTVNLRAARASKLLLSGCLGSLKNSLAVIGALHFPCSPSWCGLPEITGLVQPRWMMSTCYSLSERL